MFSEARSDKHILIIDDEKDITQIYSQMLKRLGYKVTTAHTVDQAMNTLVETTVDFVISDIKMPGASGFDLLELLEMHGTDIPVVLISGHVDSQSMQKLAPRSLKVLEKPFQFSDLASVIEDTFKLAKTG